MQTHKSFRAFAQNARAPRDRADVVIVGNGIAGLTAALEARKLAPDRHIAIITEQCHPTINTPALKQFAIGKLSQEQLLAYPAGTELTQQVDILNTRVEAISAREKYLRLSDGETFGYGTLLLATGSTPNGLSPQVPGYNFDGVGTLHRLSDYLDLRRRVRLREVQTAVVIGGGLHAMETVMGLVHEGVNVHWLIRGATFLPSMLDHAASEMVLEYSRRAGVHVSIETEVTGIIGRIGVVAGVVTNHQQTISCQLVVCCTGTTPTTTLAKQCNLPIKEQHGILVDERLHTSVRDIFAAGDAISLWNPQTRTYQRQSFWHAAVSQGRVAAAAMLGFVQYITPFGTPWHATQLGELSLLSVGHPLNASGEHTTITDKRRGSYCLLSMRDNQLVGYLSLGKTQPDGLAIKRIIDEGFPIETLEKSLLNGEFDARQHFAQRHTRAALQAHHTALTAKLPVPYTNSSQKIAVTAKLPLPETSLPGFTASPQNMATQNTEPMLRSSILQQLDEMPDDEDPLQKRIERRASLNASIKSFKGMALEERAWTIPALLPEGLVVLAGKQQIGKSCLALGMGLAIASGESSLNQSNIAPGHVLYLALEETERSLQERISQLLVRGASLHDDFEYATQWPQLDDNGLVDIESWLVARPRPRLVIIDSWATSLPGMTQHSGEPVYDRDVETFEKLRELAHAHHVSILLHYHIDSLTSNASFDKLVARSSLHACTDGVLHLKRSRNRRTATLSASGRAYTQQLRLPLSFNGGYWQVTELGHTAPRNSDALSQTHRAIVEVLVERDQPMSAKEISLALGKRDHTVRKLLLEMTSSDLIETTDRGYTARVDHIEFVS